MRRLPNGCFERRKRARRDELYVGRYMARLTLALYYESPFFTTDLIFMSLYYMYRKAPNVEMGRKNGAHGIRTKRRGPDRYGCMYDF